MYEYLNAPWPISNRDFVYIQTFTERHDGIVMYHKSIGGLIPEIDGVVRAEIHFAGFYFKKISDDITELINIGCVDIKGSIPKVLINNSGGGQITRIISLKNAIEAN